MHSFKNFNFKNLFLILWVLSLPIMLNRYFVNVSLFQRLQISDFLFLSLFILFLIKLVKHQIKFIFTDLWLPLILLIASFLISALNSGFPLVSISECIILLYLVSLYLAVMNLISDKETLSLCLKAWVFISAIVALLGIIGIILSFFEINNPFVRHYPMLLNMKYRLTSTLSLSNLAYAYFHISFFLGLAVFITEKNRRKKAVYLFINLLLIIAMIFTFSRGWVAFLLSLGIFFCFVKEKKPIFKLIAATLFFAAFILFIFIQLFITYANDVNFFVKSGYDDNYKVDTKPQAKNKIYKHGSFFEAGHQYNRIDIGVVFLPSDHWYKRKAAIKLWLQHPFFGVGPGMFSAWMQKLKESATLYIPEHLIQSKPHSAYFGALAEEGLFGLIALIILFIFFLKKSLNVFKIAQSYDFKIILLCCICSFIGLMEFGINVDIMNFRWLWFLMGLTIAIIKISQLDYQEKESER